MTYREYQDYLVDRVYEAREKFETAKTVEEKLSLAEPYKTALRNLADFLMTANVPEKVEVQGAGAP
jgi:hypothetical protein